ncbi:terminase family protein [Sphingomonas psychrotolerans]|uniref:Terminase family protein n=1 Tax=Sphingomonas psychrotolerans TaxID=1327635 RepID=A0ABU3N291_9SPHN|nr:terminase family protein [Sphingomonas psychrotolerans]MDT8758665.1 terminase family protein [Sphingomonas psychrotolerans]
MGEVLTAVRRLDAGQRARLLATLNETETRMFDADWGEWAHEGQLPPEGAWRTWVVMAGRGFGKTRAGAEWVRALVRDAATPVRIALVAATSEEARRVMIEGPSGLLTVADQRGERPRYEPSLKRLTFPGGSEATLYSGAHPESLRGPEHHYAWCDELAKWRHPKATWDMLQLGLRMGETPRVLVTTTPRAGSAALKAVLTGAAQSGGATDANPHLPPAYLEAVLAAYGGTHLGRQEIEGLLAEDLEGSLWPAALIEASRGSAPAAEALVRVVVGVDPPASAAGTCGIVVCGLDGDGVAHVLADHSASGLSPEGWAARVAAAVVAHGADKVVAEKNQGGDMVGSVLRGTGRALPVSLVSASLGKVARAAPVAALFECGKARLAGRFAELEAELATLTAGGVAGASPDRADAMVWALSALMLHGRGEPRVTGFA